MRMDRPRNLATSAAPHYVMANPSCPATQLFSDPGKKKGTLFWEDHF